MSDPSKPFTFGSARTDPLGGAKSTGAAAPSLFGTASTSGGFSGFGNSTTSNTISSGSKPGLFAGLKSSSGATASSTPAFSFGAPPASISAPSSTAPSSTATSTLPSFGSTTPAAPKTSLFAFGSTTPAGEPPKENSGLGASTGAINMAAPAPGGNIFGSGKTLFGPQSAAPPSSQPGSAKPSIFGAPTPQSPAPNTNMFGGQGQGAAPSNNLFGGPGQDKGSSSNMLANLGQTKSDAAAVAPASAVAPAAPFSFTNKQASNPQSTSNLNPPSTGATPAAAPSGQKSLFTFPPALSSVEPASNEATTPFSGFNLGGGAPPTPASTSAATLAATTAAPTFSFLPTSASTSQPTDAAPAATLFPSFTPAAASSSASQPATTAPAFTSFSIGGASTSAAQPATTASTTASTTAPSQPAALPGFAASTTGPSPPSQSRLKNRTMDEILTRWATDLTKYTKEFRTTAETVATWDQHLVDNMSKISKLYSQTLIAERQTESVEMQLSAVENQQAELESWLSVYEKQVDEMLEREGKGAGEVGGPDSEREKTYRLSEKLGERLEEMGTDLEGMVGEINAANSSLSRNGKQDEPITQIVRILNSHLTQLKAIDDGAATLNAKVEKAQKSLGSLAYSNGGMNGNGTAAVDDFYRSYLGRRG